MKFLDNYLKKRIKELDEHPELNKNRKITQAQTEKIVKFILFIIMICFLSFYVFSEHHIRKKLEDIKSSFFS